MSLASFAAPPRSLRFEQLGIRQGLVQGSVTAIVQDRQGFMWLGSQAGLSRYDGYRVTVYKNSFNDPHSLANNYVYALHVDGQGGLWVGTRGGLQRYNPATEGFARPQPDKTVKSEELVFHARDIISDGRTGLWVATPDGLRHVDTVSGRFTMLRHTSGDSTSLSNNSIRTLARDAKGNLWIGTSTGLDFLPAGSTKFQHFRMEESATPESKHNAVQSLWIDREQTLWIGTLAGLERWRLGTGEPLRRRFGRAEGLVPGRVSSLYQDQDATLWVGTQEGGLLCWDASNGRFVAYRHQPADPNSLANNYVSALYQDRTGTLWAGTWNAGASRIDLAGGGFTRFSVTAGDDASLSNNSIVRITGDGQGRLWLATGDGLNRLDPGSGKVTVFRHDPNNPGSLDNNFVKAVTNDKAGNLWVGTTTGLNRFDPVTGRFTVRTFHTGHLYSDSIKEIVCDSAGILWIASRGGLHRLDPVSNQVRTFRHDEQDSASLGQNALNKILLDRHGVLWIATQNGLDRMDRNTSRFSHFRHDPKNPASIGPGVISDLLEDTQGTLWVGTGGGLSRMESDNGVVRFRTWPTVAPIDAILEGDDGRLWISTNGGISVFNQAEGKFRNYKGGDGLIEGGYINASAFRDTDGTLYFGGLNGGLTAFQPRRVRDNPYSPAVAITDFQIFNQSVRVGKGPNGSVLSEAIHSAKSLLLSYRHSIFSFEFSALHYADPQRNRFAYQLQGFDRDWVNTDAGRRFATYTNLAPGDYVFRVKAANKDGVWNETGVSLPITITPPFWQRWWFRTLAAALLLGSAWFAYRTRILRLVQQRAVLEEQVTVRTAEVVQKNALLELQKQEVIQQKKLVEQAMTELQIAQQQLVFQEKMASVGTLTAGVAHEINNPANFAHAGAQVLEIDLERFRRFLLELAEGAETEVLDRLNQHIDALVRQVDSIVDGTSRIRGLVRDLRTFSRLDEAEKKAVSIADSLLSTVHLVRTQYAQSTEILCELMANPVLECWPAQLNQVFMNLIINACHAIQTRQMETGDTARGTLWIRSRMESGWLTFEFEDSGCGIAPGVIGRIFEPFFTTKEVGEGVGLGLSISFGIIERHGGDIQVRSTEGAGTCFTVKLPLQQEKRTAVNEKKR